MCMWYYAFLQVCQLFVTEISTVVGYCLASLGISRKFQTNSLVAGNDSMEFTSHRLTAPICRSTVKIRLLEFVSWSFDVISFSTPNTTPSLHRRPIQVLHTHTHQLLAVYSWKCGAREHYGRTSMAARSVSEKKNREGMAFRHREKNVVWNTWGGRNGVQTRGRGEEWLSDTGVDEEHEEGINIIMCKTNQF